MLLKYLTIINLKKRKFWGILITSTLLLETFSLFLQHFFLLQPCVLCIYQRCALCGITTAGIIAIINPYIPSLRFISILIWIYSAGKGLYIAKTHINIQLHPSPFSTCDLFVHFPNWLPLNKWIPYFFEAYGDCTEYKWQFLTLEISQWMLLIFSIYLLFGIFVLLTQFIKKNNNPT